MCDPNTEKLMGDRRPTLAGAIEALTEPRQARRRRQACRFEGLAWHSGAHGNVGVAHRRRVSFDDPTVRPRSL